MKEFKAYGRRWWESYNRWDLGCQIITILKFTIQSKAVVQSSPVEVLGGLARPSLRLMYKFHGINNFDQYIYSLLTIKGVEKTSLDKIPNITMAVVRWEESTQYDEQNFKGRGALER